MKLYKGFMNMFSPEIPKFGGNKKAAKKAYSLNNNGPANFKPGAKQVLKKGGNRGK